MPDWQVRPAQQESVPPQALLSAAQVGGVVHAPPRQVRPAQQAEPSEQLVPRLRQGAVQTPPRQLVPEQQSMLVVHVCPAGWHAQRPPEQPIRPQHWAASVHAPPTSRQQSAAVGVARHEAPSQHCVEEVHGDWRGLQVGALRQSPSKQTRPEPQGDALVQHARPRAPQDGPTSTGGVTTSSATTGTSSVTTGASSVTTGASSPGRTGPWSPVTAG